MDLKLVTQIHFKLTILGVIDQTASRKLTLIAKTIQNLSNFVEFGQKEPFMIPMNPFIVKKINGMKKFIDEVSAPFDKPFIPVSSNFSAKDALLSAAELSNHLISSKDKIVAGQTPPSPLVEKLVEVLSNIEERVAKIREEDDEILEYEISNDTGIEVEAKDGLLKLSQSALSPFRANSPEIFSSQNIVSSNGDLKVYLVISIWTHNLVGA